MRFLIALVVLLFTTSGVEAGPIAVRQPEGAVYGVLALRTSGGDVLAHGELIQTVRGHQGDSQLVFRFNDGSVFAERVVFSQQKLFSLTSYRLTQRGPALPGSSEVTFVRGSGQYRAKIREKPDLRYWIAAAPLPPAFVKFEGPFYLNGPVWRTELSGPRWPAGSQRR